MAKIKISHRGSQEALAFSGEQKLIIYNAFFEKGFDQAKKLSILFEFEKYPDQPFRVRFSAPAAIQNPKTRIVSFNGDRGVIIPIPKDCTWAKVYLEREPSLTVDFVMTFEVF